MLLAPWIALCLQATTEPPVPQQPQLSAQQIEHAAETIGLAFTPPELAQLEKALVAQSERDTLDSVHPRGPELGAGLIAAMAWAVADLEDALPNDSGK